MATVSFASDSHAESFYIPFIPKPIHLNILAYPFGIDDGEQGTIIEFEQWYLIASTPTEDSSISLTH